MKVLCVKIINPVTGEEVLEHGAVAIGEEYEVVSIDIEPGHGAIFRILSSESMPILFDARMFVAKDAEIPSNWIMSVEEGGLVSFGPATLVRPGFWERYFDGDREAIAQFEAERGT